MKSAPRNSNVELVRIIAMMFIIWTHLGAVPDSGLPRATFGMLQYLGGVGDNLFFSITAWFTCMEVPRFRKSCYRVWKLEQQLLFYSLGMFAVCSLIWFGTGYPILKSLFDWIHLGVVSFAPISTALWWYPTAYVVFILLSPWLTRGLKAIGKAGHAAVAAVCFGTFGILPFFNKGMDLSVFMFIYLYVLMSYLRWYLPGIEHSRVWAWSLFLGGACLVVVSYEINAFVFAWDYGVSPWFIPTMATALGIILLATQARPRHIPAVNLIAGSTLSVYLVHMYWPITIWLQHALSGALTYVDAPAMGRYAVYYALTLIVYAAIIILDLIRRAVFSITVERDNRERRLFGRMWIIAMNRMKIVTNG